ncbi:hypothetical protein ACFV27_00830 [Streptomyces antimycoticus]|uniref:hypothetical protein n=1 Tax=Streptomyces antimycoticus TaxID=68175 RepID=UPI003673B7DC
MLDRYRIDDGRHLPEIVVDEDASTAAGDARWRASCSCDRMPAAPAGTRGQALAAHLDHVRTRLSPTRGPSWLPAEVRIVVLLLLMLAVALGGYFGGLVLVDHYALAGPGAMSVRAGSLLGGFGGAFLLMVAGRHFIAPTRA